MRQAFILIPHSSRLITQRSVLSIQWVFLHSNNSGSLSKGCGANPPVSRQSQHRFTTQTCCQAIEPGSSPEDVVKRISKKDVEINFARSGGAGGQNVNKVNTKVDMRLNLDQEWLSEEMLDSLQRLEKKRINKEGELVIASTKTRSQANNVEDALEKMQSALDRAAESIIPAKPDPEKAKEMAKRARVANEHRIQNKKMQSDKKKERKSKIDW